MSFIRFVTLLVVTVVLFVPAIQSVSAQQGFSPSLKHELRPFAVGEQRNFLVDVGDLIKDGVVIQIQSPGGGYFPGIQVRELELIDERTVDVRIRTSDELDPDAESFVLVVGNIYGYHFLTVPIHVHEGMPVDVLSATGLIGGSGAPIYSASLSPTDPRYYRRQVLQLFLVSDRKSSVKTEAIDKVVKKFRTRLESSNWTFDDGASKTDLVSLIADERTRSEFQSLLSKNAENKNSIQLFARKDGSELILMFVRDPIDGSWRALTAQNPAP